MTPASLPNWLDPEQWLPNTESTDKNAIRSAILSENPTERELALMLSPAAGEFLELMAQRAQAITRRHFGRTISLYTPLYLSNFCNGGCLYCGIAGDRRAKRAVLDETQLRHEMQAIQKMHFEELVLLTGERMPEADVPYLRDSIAVAAEYIHNVNIEVFPMAESEYRTLAEAGCTGMTVYQETYDQTVYEKMHRWGDKRDFFSRLNAPDRALRGGLRTVGIGALLGLADPKFDMLCVYRHAKYLQKNYWQAGVSVSFPRIRPQLGGFAADHPVDEKMLAQFIFALRICLPEIPLVLSTREAPRVRDGMAGLGISKMSIASKTTVGGYSGDSEESTEQFSISDERNIPEFCNMLCAKGLEPVFKNWDSTYRDPAHYEKP
ncbi:2-iminoacetate synthase ThiH [Pontiella sulfatireligans]|uniref:2-iminoacetate synthase n=1 Tax=Pontiella sulfatireligans TaxID=2750658 RepID=A0A6C2US64_9BACT|nr:2-iminoacetate synthase ThiH [Pontiella sulfatireligans]VGO21766.1 2-iminoacetate synthase [Pontiella sulfatireligans]